MSINSRVKEIRKQSGMSQKEFAERLGIAQTGVSYMEKDGSNISAASVKNICFQFNIREEWLLNGTGEMFGSSEAQYSTLIDRVMTGENEFAKNIFKTFALFDEKDWGALQAMIEKYLNVTDAEDVPEEKPLYDDVPDTPEELEKQFPPVDSGGNSDVG